MSLSVRGSNKGEREKGVCICMRVDIGVGGMKVWVIAKISIALGLWGGGGICIRVYIGVGGMKMWVIAKISIALGGGGGGN